MSKVDDVQMNALEAISIIELLLVYFNEISQPFAEIDDQTIVTSLFTARNKIHEIRDLSDDLCDKKGEDDVKDSSSHASDLAKRQL